LDSLAQLPIYTPSGAVLPLVALASIEESIGTDSLRRVNGRRTVTLNIIPPRSVPLETGVARVREELVDYLRERGDIPAGVDISISGAADQLDANRCLATTLLLYLSCTCFWSQFLPTGPTPC
jgi:multidrug efflux pump subunit AcrB